MPLVVEHSFVRCNRNLHFRVSYLETSGKVYSLPLSLHSSVTKLSSICTSGFAGRCITHHLHASLPSVMATLETWN
jgi:hypothetical protein